MVSITKQNDDAGKPEKTWILPMGSQTAEIIIQWLPPGAIGWTGVPSERQPWLIVPAMLFRLELDPTMDCDQWLGRQVVHLDNRGISLREIFQTVVNYETAHAVGTSLLAGPVGTKSTKAA